MKKKRTKVPNGRPKPKPKPKKKSQSPWHKYKTVAPKVRAGELERQAFGVVTPVDREGEIILGGNPDALADEIEAMEADPNAEPPEESE
jgi:hypothetical protein